MNHRDSTDPFERNRPGGVVSFLLCVVDFGLLNAAFFFLNYWKRGTLDLSSRYERLLLISYGIWFVVSLLTRKFRVRAYGGYWDVIALYVRSGLYGAYCAAFIVVMWGLSEYSRLHVFGTWGLLALMEGVLFSGYYVVAGSREQGAGCRGLEGERVRGLEGERVRRGKVSRFLVVSDFVLVGGAFFIANYLKRGNFYLLPEYEKMLLIMYGLWFGTSLTTRKFVRGAYPNYYHALWPWLKTVVLMVAMMSILVFGLRIFYFSRTQVFGTMLVLLALEVLFVGLYFMVKKHGKAGRDIETIDDVKARLRQRPLPADMGREEIRRFLMTPVRGYLKAEVLKGNSQVFEMLARSVNLEDIVQAETAVLESNEILKPGLMGSRPLRLFINLRKINDVRWMNRYFLSVYESLSNGGYFFSKAHTIYTHRKWIYRKYPKQIANGIYLIDFVMNRIIPKLPVTKQIYFALTKGKGRVLSKAEVLGRLCFCGFDIVAEKEIDDRLYFLVRKAKTASVEQNPSYGPLVGFTRIGADNEPIRVHKFRTMHPYSEFLQDYVYAKSGLREGGKLEDDFRMTEWGKCLRRLWLDELPMLYNWVRGDLKLFGVRPLSPHYLSLYPSDLQEMRGKVKPGLVPPFYADMPKTFDEICESERRYIEAYLEHPIKTQWGYFWWAFYNIVFKGARSH